MTGKKRPKEEKERAATPAQTAAPETSQEGGSFPIVGIGASAGGLAAFEEFFANLPATTPSGMAFVLVQHLDPDHKSILTELVKKYTEMQVSEAADGLEVQPNCAYIIPPNKALTLMHGHLYLLEPVAARGLRLPIDHFFRSLAQDQHERAICIVLSGTGTDGTLGLKEIKGVGGMTMVQDPASAKYDGMPRSAIATGMVDYVLPPSEMPAHLTAYAEHAFGQRIVAALPAPDRPTNALQKIFVLLRSHTGHDFAYYKHNTTHRRVERRMAVNQIDELDQYVRYLQQNPLELDALFRELLIGVTSFFRDPEAFETLQKRALAPLLAGLSPDQTLRIWVPGCSTGEEAYSIAMLAQEEMEASQRHVNVQVFATDIDAEAIERARAGVYPDSIAADVSPERLSRFFHQDRDGHTYRIGKAIRDTVIFAVQNAIKDPPFSRIDLISCRNLLIYLGVELQKKIIPLFHYSLSMEGYLLLGSSETVGEYLDLFAPVDRKWKLFRRRGVASQYRAGMDFVPLSPTHGPMPLPALAQHQPVRELGMKEFTERTLLAEHTPACAVVNEKAEVLYIHGRTGRYLEPAPGEASMNILRMARQGLRLELTTGLRRALGQKAPVRYPGLRVKTNGQVAIVDLLIKPIQDPASLRGLIMVLFSEVAVEEQPLAGEVDLVPVGNGERRVADLERELRAKEEYLQTIIEELETSNEEQQSANEELQSTNEELQSTNEELETSKEEMQSVNEELITVNAELRQKLDQLAQSNNDMNNLLAGTGIGTIFVDNHLIIKRFTPAATRVINLIQSDVGRPVSHIVSKLAYDDLVQDVQSVLDTLIPKEVEVRASDEGWYLLRILPYRTVENVIDGAVLTFVDILEQKEAQARLSALTQSVQEARDYAQNIVDTVRQPLVVLDGDLRVVSANPAFYRSFELSQDETLGKLLYELGNRQWDIPQLREVLEELLPKQMSFEDLPIEYDLGPIGRRVMRLNAREVIQQAGKERLILLVMEDVTE